MKEKKIEQALAEARSELSHGDYLTLCASLTFLNREIPEASVSDGDIFYMLGWLTQVCEGMGIDYTKHEAFVSRVWISRLQKAERQSCVEFRENLMNICVILRLLSVVPSRVSFRI